MDSAILTQHHTEAVFILGGRFMLEESRVRRDRCAPQALAWPERAVALRWDEVTTRCVDANGEVFTKSERTQGPTLWRGLELTREQVDDLLGADSTLASNMRLNRLARVVQTRCGTTHPLEPADHVIADPMVEVPRG